MASESDRPQLEEEENSDDYGAELNTTPTDDGLAALSALARGAGELMIIQTLQRYIGPVFVPILKPLIRQIVAEQVGLAKQEILASMKRNPANEATTSVPKRLKLQFRNRVCLPVYTGRPLLGENGTTIQIALVDARTEQIMNTGIESTAKLEIIGFRVGDDDRVEDCLTFQDFQEMVFSEKKGKRILQGTTCLQLKDGVCFVSKISFTHTSENTKNGLYRLGAGVVDAGLMSSVEVARTEAFLMKDGRTKYSEKHTHPRLLDKVCHLQHISYKGSRHRNLKDEGVLTVKDFLTLLHTDPKRLQDILKLRASSNTWNDIVNNAEASNGVFLYLDPGKDRKTGVVLDVKLQLKGLIAEPHTYIPAHHLSAKQKVENKELVKFASEHFEMLHFFEDETSLKENLIACTTFSSLPSANQSSGTSNMVDEKATPSSLMSTDTPLSLNNSNSHEGQHMAQAPTVTSQYDRGKAIAYYDNEMTYSMNYHQQDMPALESPNVLNFGTATEQHAYYPSEPGTSFQADESPVHTCEHMNNSDVFGQCMDWLINDPEFFENIGEYLNDSMNSDSDVMMVAARARTRWTKVIKLLRRNSVRERIGLPGIQALKKQRCC